MQKTKKPTYARTKRSQKKWRPSPFLWLGCIVALVILVGLGLELGGVTHFFHKGNPSPITVSPTKARNGTNSQTPNSSNAAQSVKNPNGSNASGSEQSKQPVLPGSPSSSGSGTLIAPYGQFVNFHKPASADSTEQSACNTSAGASCVISFSLNGVTKSLPAVVADGSGAAIWPAWTPRSIGLNSGSWTIKATATLGDQTKSTSDTKELVIP